jgi:hypothetical protein
MPQKPVATGLNSDFGLTDTQLERFFTAKIARIEAPASEDAGKPMAGKVSPFQLVE